MKKDKKKLTLSSVIKKIKVEKKHKREHDVYAAENSYFLTIPNPIY
jgi:hypothetical protein